jgi:hypothetical protein
MKYFRWRDAAGAPVLQLPGLGVAAAALQDQDSRLRRRTFEIAHQKERGGESSAYNDHIIL